MRTKNNQQPEYVDGYEGMADAFKKMNKTESQCETCKNSVGFDGCLKHGKAPDKYASVLANVKCPEREEK